MKQREEKKIARTRKRLDMEFMQCDDLSIALILFACTSAYSRKQTSILPHSTFSGIFIHCIIVACHLPNSLHLTSSDDFISLYRMKLERNPRALHSIFLINCWTKRMKLNEKENCAQTGTEKEKIKQQKCIVSTVRNSI